MDDYIRRRSAIEALWQEPSYVDPLNVLAEARDRINAISPVDVVKVVRCKDCLIHGLCRFEQGLGLDGFCSKGERKDG